MDNQNGRLSITDRDGGALIMDRTQGGLYASVREASGGGTSTAGPFMPERVHAALDAVAPAWSYTRTDEEDWQALTEPPTRPEGAAEIEALIDKAGEGGERADNESLANYLAALLFDPTVKEA